MSLCERAPTRAIQVEFLEDVHEVVVSADLIRRVEVLGLGAIGVALSKPADRVSIVKHHAGPTCLKLVLTQ